MPIVRVDDAADAPPGGSPIMPVTEASHLAHFFFSGVAAGSGVRGFIAASGKATPADRILCYNRPMKTLGTLAITFLLAAAAWGQEAKPDCPRVILSGGEGVPTLGDELPYTLTITGTEGLALEIVWETSNGKIVRGQGTRKAAVAGWTYGGVNVRVEVKGLPPGCPGVAAETMSICPPPRARAIDGYRTLAQSAEKERWASFVNLMHHEVPSRGAVIFSAKDAADRNDALRRARALYKYISSIDADAASKISFAFDVSGTRSVTMFAVPQGADFPTCASKCTWVRGDNL